LSYEDNDVILGNAKLNTTILRDSFEISNQESIHEQVTL
jgi:hypothetical protein